MALTWFFTILQDIRTKSSKKSEIYWDWELTNDTKPIWVGIYQFYGVVSHLATDLKVPLYMCMLIYLVSLTKKGLLTQMRTPKEVTEEEYHAFYKSTFKEYMDPLAYTHFTAEVCPLPCL